MPTNTFNVLDFTTAASFRGPRPWVDVKAYGARGDASTNDTTAIQAAIDSLAATGGVIYFPASTYRISSGLALANSRITLRGDGVGNTVLDYRGTGGTAITVTALQQVGIEGMTISDGATGDTGVSFEHNASITGNRYSMRDVRVTGFATHGVALRNCELALLDSVWCDANGIGIFADSAKHSGGANGMSNVFNRCRASANTGDGWDLGYQEGLSLVGCQAFNNGTGNANDVQMRVRGTCRGASVVGADVENPTNSNAGVGLQVGGKEHVVSVVAHGLGTGIKFDAATLSCILNSKFSATVTTKAELNNTSNDCLVILPGQAVTNSGARNFIIGTQPSVTGSRSLGTALTNLLTTLGTIGIVKDDTIA